MFKEGDEQEFYAGTQQEHRAAAVAVLDRERDFAARLAGVLHAGVDVLTPYHSFAASFFKTGGRADLAAQVLTLIHTLRH